MLNSLPVWMSSAYNLCKQFGRLIRIQSVWHSESTPQRIFWKHWFRKISTWKFFKHAECLKHLGTDENLSAFLLHFLYEFKCIFNVWFNSLHPSQQFFSYVGTGLLGLKQYYAARINMSCLKDTTQWSRWGLNLQLFSLYSSTRHWATVLPFECTQY